jgi:hypothetical protein
MEDEPGEDLEQSREALPKNLFRLLTVQDPKGERFRNLLSCSSVHTGAQDGEDYGGGAAARRGKTLTQIILILVKADRLHI